EYASYDDHQLVQLLQEQDAAAYAEIYTRFWPVLFRHARRMLQDDDEATDVVQDIFVTLWEKASSLALRGSLAGYLYSATRNRVIDRIKHHRLERQYLHSLENYLEQGSETTSDTVLAAELARRIEAEVAHLPTKMQRIFRIRQETNLSSSQIAEDLETTEGNVKKQL